MQRSARTHTHDFTTELGGPGLSYPNQIHQQGRLEHPVESHVLVVEQIFEAAPAAVFRHNTKDAKVEEQSQEQVDVLVPHIPELERSVMETGMCMFTAARSG